MRVLNARETNTILHALRSMAYNAKDDTRDSCERAACGHFEDGLKPLSYSEIDDLCESIGLDSLTLKEDDDFAANPLDEAYRAAAEEKFGSEGQVEIDSDALISYGDDDGAYVQAWVWVEGDLVPSVCSEDSCDTLVTEDDEYFATPCGSYCDEHMPEHAKGCGICANEFDLETEEEETK